MKSSSRPTPGGVESGQSRVAGQTSGFVEREPACRSFLRNHQQAAERMMIRYHARGQTVSNGVLLLSLRSTGLI